MMNKHGHFTASLVAFCVAATLAAAADPPTVVLSEGVTADFPKALQTVQLVQAGDFAKAKEVLLPLTQKDFARKPRMEMMGEDQAEIVDVPAIGSRDLLLARCHFELGEHQPAQALLWGLVEKECTARDLFVLFVREFEGERFELAEKKLNEIQTRFPHNDAAMLARQYLTVAHSLPNGNVAAAVGLIRSGAWKRDSERGPLAEFKEWACAQLAKHPRTTLPVLIDALAANEQPTWIIYCLGQCGARQALVPLEKARERIKNYYARLEIDTALARIKKTDDETVEPQGGGYSPPAARSAQPTP